MIDIEAVEHLRIERGWTKSELASRAGISPQYLSDLIARRRKGVNPAIAKGLAEALGLPNVRSIWTEAA